MEDTTEEKMKERINNQTLHYSIDLDMTLNRLRFLVFTIGSDCCRNVGVLLRSSYYSKGNVV